MEVLARNDRTAAGCGDSPKEALVLITPESAVPAAQQATPAPDIGKPQEDKLEPIPYTEEQRAQIKQRHLPEEWVHDIAKSVTELKE